MILDIEFRTLTESLPDTQLMRGRLQVRTRSVSLSIYNSWRDFEKDSKWVEWSAWQDVPRIDRSELPEEER